MCGPCAQRHPGVAPQTLKIFHGPSNLQGKAASAVLCRQENKITSSGAFSTGGRDRKEIGFIRAELLDIL